MSSSSLLCGSPGNTELQPASTSKPAEAKSQNSLPSGEAHPQLSICVQNIANL